MTTKLQAVRLSKGLTQADIVKRTGITQSTVSQFEAGIRNFTNARVDTVVKIADALGVTDVRELLESNTSQANGLTGTESRVILSVEARKRIQKQSGR